MQAFLARAEQAATKIEPFGKTILFDFGDDGKVFADAKARPIHFEHGTSFATRADCFVKTKLSVLERLIAGTLDPMTAMFTGRLKVSGEMDAALELAKRLRAVDA
ncbi:MAG: SCP2 sterol-binding domain-containing protein [Robiginitomaculum sp.]|nr:SCP2 sterol-binding domain-containing protein [Robiginitomaculum sp.]